MKLRRSTHPQHRTQLVPDKASRVPKRGHRLLDLVLGPGDFDVDLGVAQVRTQPDLANRGQSTRGSSSSPEIIRLTSSLICSANRWGLLAPDILAPDILAPDIQQPALGQQPALAVVKLNWKS